MTPYQTQPLVEISLQREGAVDATATTFKHLNKSISAEELMHLLKNPISRDGICGKFHFANTEQAGPHYAYPVQLKIIKDGKIEIAKAN